jgi:hypothetical protein
VSASVTWSGLDDLKAALRRLPVELTVEGAHIIEATANGAAHTIKAGYPVRTGKLRDKLTVEHERSPFGARSVVKNTSKYADEFEYGTQARHRALGATGSMPPNHLFLGTIERARAHMWPKFKDLLVRHGLSVSGDAG